jgi:hypothetical protein
MSASAIPNRHRETLASEYSVDDDWRLSKLGEFWSHYQDIGLIRDEEPIALHHGCQHADSCWNGRRRPHGTGPEYGISLPWIGAGYRDGDPRVLLIAMNIRGSGETGLLTQHHIIKTLVLEKFSTEDEDPRNIDFVRFHSNAWQAAAQVLASRESVRAWVSDADRTNAVNSCAFLEAVKCPTHPGGPTGAMWRNCPPYVQLRKEVEILEPAVLLVFGADVPAALQTSGLPGEWTRAPFVRVETQLNHGALSAFCLYHPSNQWGRDWDQESLNPLEDELRARAV